MKQNNTIYKKGNKFKIQFIKFGEGEMKNLVNFGGKTIFLFF